MTVVPMQERHLAALAEIEKVCFHAPWSADMLREELGKGLFLVAERDGVAVGYVGCQTVLDEGYIKSFQNVDDGKQGIIRIALKYGPNKSQVITGLRRVSKPGLRIYTSCKDAPKVMKGLGIAILSTPKGIMTDKTARKENVGGEVLAFVW